MKFPNIDLNVIPKVDGFFDAASNTISYIVQDRASASCAIIDSVLDMDYEWIIETHVHADHLSAAPYIQEKLGGKIGVGTRITEVQDTFGKVFNEGTEFQRSSATLPLLAILFSCRMAVQREPTFPAAMLASFTIQFSACCRSRMICACSFAMTTAPVDVPFRGRHRSVSKGPRTFMSAMGKPAKSSLPFGRKETRNSQCPS